MLLVITSTGREAAALHRAVDGPVTSRPIHGVPVREGRLGGATVRIAVTGLARTNTGYHLGRLLLEPTDAVLQIGVGGTFDADQVGLGEVAVATSDTYADLGSLTETGWLSLDDIGLPLVETDGAEPIGVEFPCDAGAATAVADALDAIAGPFVTVETITGTERVARSLHDRTGAVIESMEGAAAAHACTLAGVPFVQVRAASNVVGPRDRGAWRLDEAIASVSRAAVQAVSVLAGRST